MITTMQSTYTFTQQEITNYYFCNFSCPITITEETVMIAANYNSTYHYPNTDIYNLYKTVPMQTHSGCMFGGYTDLSWSSRFKRGKFWSSPNCFLFTLVNPFDTPPTKFDVLHPPYAINNHPG